jgi:hypothetical protein
MGFGEDSGTPTAGVGGGSFVGVAFTAGLLADVGAAGLDADTCGASFDAASQFILL